MSEKTRYSDAELEEFRAIILQKLELAQRDYDSMKATLMNTDCNGVDDTTRLAERQLKFIGDLKAALVRIENKTYGVCRVTGKLIPAERLRAVPHATLSIEAKQMKK